MRNLRLVPGVAPIYRSHRWPSHDAANRQFIYSLTPLLATHGAAIAARLAKSYGKTWHERPVRVDVIHDAGPPGNAHTVSEPLHITSGASDPRHQGHHALELIFHEASHGWDDGLIKEVGDAAARLGVSASRPWPSESSTPVRAGSSARACGRGPGGRCRRGG